MSGKKDTKTKEERINEFAAWTSQFDWTGFEEKNSARINFGLILD
jgi:hypothetical protein